MMFGVHLLEHPSTDRKSNINHVTTSHFTDRILFRLVPFLQAGNYERYLARALIKRYSYYIRTTVNVGKWKTDPGTCVNIIYI